MNRQTAQLLEQHFDTTFAAPDGIAKLRELILTLAMQGKLVEQDANDAPASELLREIEAEKQRLISSSSPRRRGSSKPLTPIKPKEVPYELPLGWEWVRLGALTNYNFGKTPASKNPIYWSETDGCHWASISDMPTRGYLEETSKRVTKKAISDVFKYEPVPPGSLLMSFKLSIGKTAITKIDTYHNEAIISFVHLDDRLKMYLFWILYEIANSGNTKGAIKGRTLNSESISELLIPLPPSTEQHRIVARIDQLMARCDALEKLRKEREEKRLAVHAAAIKQLLDSDPSFPRRRESSSSEELDPRLRGGDEKGCGSNSVSVSAWDFIQQHFGALYTVKENVAELRKAILQLAVMGRLVPQNPNDPPASQLLKEIEAEKQRLVKAGKIKKPKPLPPIKPEEVPYQLPQGWEWVRFGDLTTEIATGPFGSMIHKSDYVSDGIPLINPSHMIDGKIAHDSSVSVSQNMAKKLSSYRLFENDIVMARRGEMGRCAIVTTESDGFLCGTGSFVLRFIDDIERQYILNLFKTEYVREYLGGNSVGTTMTNLNHGILNNMPVLLPSLPEQHRIVARIDQLMALCDTLDLQIAAATGKQTELLGAVMGAV